MTSRSASLLSAHATTESSQSKSAIDSEAVYQVPVSEVVDDWVDILSQRVAEHHDRFHYDVRQGTDAVTMLTRLVEGSDDDIDDETQSNKAFRKLTEKQIQSGVEQSGRAANKRRFEHLQRVQEENAQLQLAVDYLAREECAQAENVDSRVQDVVQRNESVDFTWPLVSYCLKQNHVHVPAREEQLHQARVELDAGWLQRSRMRHGVPSSRYVANQESNAPSYADPVLLSQRVRKVMNENHQLVGEVDRLKEEVKILQGKDTGRSSYNGSGSALDPIVPSVSMLNISLPTTQSEWEQLYRELLADCEQRDLEEECLPMLQAEVERVKVLVNALGDELLSLCNP